MQKKPESQTEQFQARCHSLNDQIVSEVVHRPSLTNAYDTSARMSGACVLYVQLQFVGADAMLESCKKRQIRCESKLDELWLTWTPFAVKDSTLASIEKLRGPFRGVKVRKSSSQLFTLLSLFAHVHLVSQEIVFPEELISVEFWFPTPASRERLIQTEGRLRLFAYPRPINSGIG